MLYLGSQKIKLSIGEITSVLQFFSSSPIINGITLMSSDGYILKDSDGLYLTTQEE